MGYVEHWLADDGLIMERWAKYYKVLGSIPIVHSETIAARYQHGLKVRKGEERESVDIDPRFSGDLAIVLSERTFLTSSDPFPYGMSL